MAQHTRNEFGMTTNSFNIEGFSEISMLTATPLPYDSEWIVDWNDQYESAVFQTIVDETYKLIQELMKDYSESYEGYVYDEHAEDEERWFKHTVSLKDFVIEVSSQNNGYYGAIYSINIEMRNGWDQIGDDEVYAVTESETLQEFASALIEAINNNLDTFWEITAEAPMYHSDMCELAQEETA